MMDEPTRKVLEKVGREFGTPSYVYFLDPILEQVESLERAFHGQFVVSYAIKSNPNTALLRSLRGKVNLLDASSVGELERGLRAGFPAEALSFSGPGKREFELVRAVEAGAVEMVCESECEIETLDEIAGLHGRRMPVLLRINPARVPRGFGVNMAGKPSPFGIDEEDVGKVISDCGQFANLRLQGFHIYSGTNSLSEEAIAENFAIFIELFTRFAETHDLYPHKLVFGSGFGIPYSDEQRSLNLESLAALINPQIGALRRGPRFRDTRLVLEMGRFLVGPHGYFLTSVVNEKRSRGAEIRICDGGMNNHLAACGLMGMIIRRNWPMWKVNGRGSEPLRRYILTGPLCTTIDTLGHQVALPELRRGDLIAIGSSGAYGLTSSPTRFIGHPEPREYLVTGSDEAAEIADVSESELNATLLG
jgi:diaminopimelate decarboxylase